MKKLILAVTTLTALFLAAPAVRACPLCKEAIPEGADGQSQYDSERQSSGYNYSIYFMLSVPFALAGGVGFMIYRQCRKVDDAHARE